ncbi:sigma-54 interaction domain protein, partial [Vibrio parahaemolyticus V-223/04]
IIASMY